jgi:hypothetical protein
VKGTEFVLRDTWQRVLHWACRRSPKVRALKLNVNCALVKRTRAASPRAYMHTLHKRGKVCVHGDAAALSLPQLVGLYLHEIGHPLAQDAYGRSEQEDADRAVKEFLGVKIQYKGPLLLEWVSPSVARRILGV